MPSGIVTKTLLSPMTESFKQFLHRVVSRVVPVERDELPALVWSFVYFFCVLAAYYLLRPVRDEMGVLSGAHNLPWLFSAVFVTMLVVIPVFGWVAGHFQIRRLLPTVYGFFILNLLLFFVALQGGVGLQAFGPIFFVWLSVFNLFVVSVFWSFMADVFRTDAARRLFGCISADQIWVRAKNPPAVCIPSPHKVMTCCANGLPTAYRPSTNATRFSSS